MENRPSLDKWLEEARREQAAGNIGMYLIHNGVVRTTPKAAVRNGEDIKTPVTGMRFSYDGDKVNAFVEETRQLEGIYMVRVWLNEGLLAPGDDIMLVLIGGDIRPRVIDALNRLVDSIKNECVSEEELF